MLGHVMPLGDSRVGDRVLVLDVDADLAAAVPEGRRERAVADARVPEGHHMTKHLHLYIGPEISCAAHYIL